MSRQRSRAFLESLLTLDFLESFGATGVTLDFLESFGEGGAAVFSSGFAFADLFATFGVGFAMLFLAFGVTSALGFVAAAFFAIRND
jgi:hypothetical protein